jgi:hypothetical protein
MIARGLRHMTEKRPSRSYRTHLPRELEDRLCLPNLERMLPDDNTHRHAVLALKECEKRHPNFLFDDNIGSATVIVGDATMIGANGSKLHCWPMAAPTIEPIPNGNRRLRLVMADFEMETGTHGKPDLSHVKWGRVSGRIDLPLALIRKGAERLENYILYHVRFNLDAAHGLEAGSRDPLLRGYFGITRRSPYVRLREHLEKAINNNGSLLHSAWHALREHHSGAHPVFQITGSATTLKEIYEFEEKVVAEHTLAPKGLNAIAGGEAGIRQLYKLGVLAPRSKLPSYEERDAALAEIERTGGTPKAHYRRAHIRRLDETRTTFVNGCWVAVKPVVAEPVVDTLSAKATSSSV